MGTKKGNDAVGDFFGSDGTDWLDDGESATRQSEIPTAPPVPPELAAKGRTATPQGEVRSAAPSAQAATGTDGPPRGTEGVRQLVSRLERIAENADTREAALCLAARTASELLGDHERAASLLSDPDLQSTEALQLKIAVTALCRDYAGHFDALKALAETSEGLSRYETAVDAAGLAARQLERPTEAVALLESALESEPDGYLALVFLEAALSADDPRRAEVLSRMVQLADPCLASELGVEEARVLRTIGQPEEAEVRYRAVLEAYPGHPEAFVELAQAFADRPCELAVHFETVAASGAEEARGVWYWLAAGQWSEGGDTAAETRCIECAADAGHPAAQIALRRAWLRAGRIEPFLAAWDAQAQNEAPGSELLSAWLRLAAGVGLDDRLRHLDQLSASDESTAQPLLWLWRAQCHEALDTPSQAMEAYSRLAALECDDEVTDLAWRAMDRLAARQGGDAWKAHCEARAAQATPDQGAWQWLVVAGATPADANETALRERLAASPTSAPALALLDAVAGADAWLEHVLSVMDTHGSACLGALAAPLAADASTLWHSHAKDHPLLQFAWVPSDAPFEELWSSLCALQNVDDALGHPNDTSDASDWWKDVPPMDPRASAAARCAHIAGALPEAAERYASSGSLLDGLARVRLLLALGQADEAQQAIAALRPTPDEASAVAVVAASVAQHTGDADALLAAYSAMASDSQSPSLRAAYAWWTANLLSAVDQHEAALPYWAIVERVRPDSQVARDGRLRAARAKSDLDATLALISHPLERALACGALHAFSRARQELGDGQEPLVDALHAWVDAELEDWEPLFDRALRLDDVASPEVCWLARQLPPEHSGLQRLLDRADLSDEARKGLLEHRATADNPEVAVAAWRALGNLANARGNVAEAADAFARVVATDPDDLDAHRFLITQHTATSNVAAALPHFRAVAAGMPEPDELDDVDARLESASLLTTYARLLLDTDQPQEALTQLSRAASYNPSDEEALRMMAGVYVEQRDWQSANAVYQKLLALFGGRGERGVIASLYASLGQTEMEMAALDKAQKRLARVQQLFPSSPLAAWFEALLAERKEDWADAMERYNDIIQDAASPQHVVAAYLAKARILDVHLRLPDKATEHCANCIDYDGTQAAPHLWMSEFKRRGGDEAAAAQHVDAAVRLEDSLGPRDRGVLERVAALGERAPSEDLLDEIRAVGRIRSVFDL